MATKETGGFGSVEATAQFPTTLKKVSVRNRRLAGVGDPPSIDVEPNGHTTCNRATAKWILEVVDAQGIQRDKFVLEVLADEFGRCALTPVSDNILDGAKVTLYRRKGTLGFQMTDVFDEYPKLRPVVRQRYAPTFTTNAEGKPCILLSLTLGRDNPKASGSPKSK